MERPIRADEQENYADAMDRYADESDRIRKEQANLIIRMQKRLDESKQENKEFEHQMKCNTCGDYFDMRNLDRVAFHESCERLVPYKQGQALKQKS